MFPGCWHPQANQVIVGRDCVGDIVLLGGSSAGAAIAAVVQVKNAEPFSRISSILDARLAAFAALP
jgi:hypothetical protein